MKRDRRKCTKLSAARSLCSALRGRLKVADVFSKLLLQSDPRALLGNQPIDLSIISLIIALGQSWKWSWFRWLHIVLTYSHWNLHDLRCSGWAVQAATINLLRGGQNFCEPLREVHHVLHKQNVGSSCTLEVVWLQNSTGHELKLSSSWGPWNVLRSVTGTAEMRDFLCRASNLRVA